MTLRLLRLGGLVACFLSLASCGDDADPVAVADAACVVDADCASGSCQFGICAVGEARVQRIALLMEPPAFRADLMPLHVTALDVELGQNIPDFGLRVPVEVPGVIRFNAVGDNAGAPVDAELRFVSTRGIPGYRFEATTQTTAGTGEYRVLLPPGTYDLTVDPDRNDAARSTIRGVEVRGVGDFRAFNVPAPAQYAVVTGVVERQADSAVPLTGARVSAQTTDGRLESTSDTTDEDGRFVLLVPPSEAEWVLRVRSSDEADWVPNVTFEAIPLGSETTAGEQVRLSIGDWRPTIPVSFTVTTPSGDPAASAVLAVRSDVRTWEGTDFEPGVADGHYEVLIEPDAFDADGRVTVQLPPGRATVYAASLDPALGMGVPVLLDVDEDAEFAEFDVVVEQRHRVQGTVSAGGRAVSGATVDARLVPTETMPLELYPLPSTVFGATTTSGMDGAFGVSLQPGVWEIEAIPETGEGYARTTVRFEMGRGSDEAVELALTEAGVVRGRLLDDLNLPLAGATIRAFRIDDGVATPLGESVTDSDGVYRLVLPDTDGAADE